MLNLSKSDLSHKRNTNLNFIFFTSTYYFNKDKYITTVTPPICMGDMHKYIKSNPCAFY